MTRDGRKKTVSALVVVGNKKGAIGMGHTKIHIWDCEMSLVKYTAMR